MQRIRRFLQEAVATRSGRIWVAVGFITAVTLIVATLLRGLGQVDSFGDGWWWAVRHLIDPGALGDDETWMERLVGLALTLSGIVLLVGVILEVLTEAVARSFEYLDKAAVATEATGHVVFVGWSERLPEVIETLAAATAQARSNWSREVVVLVPPDANRDRDEVRTRLRLRHGLLHVQAIMAAVDEHGFHLANCRAAQAIVILRDESRLEDPVVQDLESTRRTLLLARHLEGAHGGAVEPAVFFEIARAANIDAAARLVPSRFDSIVGDRMLSALLRDTLLEPAWSQAIDRLLNPRVVPSLAVVSSLGYGGLRFGDLSGRLEGATAVAVVPARAQGAVQVAPLPGTVLEADDQIIAVVGGDTPRMLPPSRLEPANPGKVLPAGDEPYRVLLIGWNTKVPTYLEELAQTIRTRFQVTSLSSMPKADRVAEVAPVHCEALDLQCLVGDPMRRVDLAAAMETARPKAIVITSTPIWGGAPLPEVLHTADADALVTLMHIAELVHDTVRPVILDLFDSSSARAFDKVLAFETLPSTRIFASIVAWMVLEPDTNRWVSSLFGEVSVRRASTVFRPVDGLARPFAAVHCALLDFRQVPIGVTTGDGLWLNPPADHPVKPGDRLLVIERLDMTTADAQKAGIATARIAVP